MLDKRLELMEKIKNMPEEQIRDVNIFIAGIEANRKIVSTDEKSKVRL